MSAKKTMVLVPMGGDFKLYHASGEIEYGGETTTRYAETWDIRFNDAETGNKITVKGPFIIREAA
jgi:hypothetical protein